MNDIPIAGCVNRYIQQENVQQEFQDNNIILQIKKITIKPERVELLLSDSTCFYPFYIQTQSPDANLKDFAIIRVNHFRVVRNLYIQILDYTVLKHTNSLFGSPGSIYQAYAKQQQQQQTPQPSVQKPQAQKPQAPAQRPIAQQRSNNNSAPSMNTDNVTQIKDLNTSMSNCTIRATVRSKGQVKSWTKLNNSGYLLNLELIDDSDEKNEIRVTVFGKDSTSGQPNKCALVDELMHVGSTYLISHFKVAIKNQNFNKLSHPFELTFSDTTDIKTSDQAINAHTIYNPVPLDSLQNNVDEVQNVTVDVIGYVVDNYGQATVGKNNIQKLTFKILDDSSRSIEVTAFNEKSEEFKHLQTGQIIAIKSAKVTKFSNLSLNFTYGSSYEIDPPQLAKRCHDLRQWVKVHGTDVQPLTVKAAGTGANDSAALPEITCTIDLLPLLNSGETAIYASYHYKVVGFFTPYTNKSFAPNLEDPTKTKYSYQGCSSCRKKDSNCQCATKNIINLYRTTLRLHDETGSVFADIMGGPADHLFGVTADELIKYEEPERDALFQNLCSSQFNIGLRLVQPNIETSESGNPILPKWQIRYTERLSNTIDTTKKQMQQTPKTILTQISDYYFFGTIFYNSNAMLQQQDQVME